MTKSVFTHKRENFLMGLKMDFEFSRSDKFTKDFQQKKNFAVISFRNFGDRKRFSDLAENWLR